MIIDKLGLYAVVNTQSSWYQTLPTFYCPKPLHSNMSPTLNPVEHKEGRDGSWSYSVNHNLFRDATKANRRKAGKITQNTNNPFPYLLTILVQGKMKKTKPYKYHTLKWSQKLNHC